LKKRKKHTLVKNKVTYCKKVSMRNDESTGKTTMTEERITHIKMADGTIAPVEYLTEESQQPEYVRKLARSAREASRAAIRRLLAKGIPAVFVKGRDLIRLYPDGHEEVIKENLIP
jgi:hypothetical protein